MKEKKPRLFIILFVSLLIIPLSPLKSPGCIDEGNLDDNFYSFFAPEVIKNRNESLFFLSANLFYTPDYRFNEEEEEGGIAAYDYKKENIKEWSDYFGNRLSDSTISLFVYTSSPSELFTLQFEMNSATKPDPTSYNWQYIATRATLIMNELNKEDKQVMNPALDYLLFAKKCEPIVTYSYKEIWDDNSKKDKALYASQLIQDSQKTLKSSSLPFFKLRYAFQLLRLYYFAGKYADGIALYDNTIAPLPVSGNIKTRALGYQAACYYATKDYAHANYIYAMLYSQHPEDCNSIIYSFHPQNETDWNATLALAKTDEDKIALWHLLGIYADPLRAMKNIKAINPKSDKMDLLLTRAINIEELYLIPANKKEIKVSPYVTKPNFDKTNTATPLLDFVKECTANGEVADPALWNIAEGYLHFITDKNFAEAEKCFTKARSYSPAPIQEQQIKLIEVLFRINELKRIEPADENGLLQDMSWLQYEKTDSSLRRNHAMDYLHIQLAGKYLQQMDTFHAELCFHNVKYFNSAAHTKQMYDFMTSPKLTGWDKFLLKNYYIQKKDMIEWQAINLMYKEDFDGALKKIAEDTTAGMERLYGDPFLIHVKDCHDCDFEALKEKGITKLDFMRRMIALRNQSKTKAPAEYYLEFANGLYNMTWYGNARHFYECKISEDMAYDSNDGPLYYNHTFCPGDSGIDDTYYPPLFDYFNCSPAQKYYQLAYDKAPDKEFAAKCCWMLAKCELNSYYNGLSNRPGRLDRENFKCGPHVKMLKEKYADTQYYNEVIKECGYFRTYLGKK